MFFITFVPLNPRSKNVHFVLKIGTFRFADYSILKYLDRKEDFNYLKNESIFRYKALKLPIDELENIEW